MKKEESKFLSCKDFSIKRKAQVGVLTLILLILIAIVMFIILWNIIFMFMNKTSEDIEVSRFRLNGDIDYWLDAVAVIQVHRGTGTGNITGVKITFKDGDGNIYIYTSSTYPDELETETYVIFTKDTEPEISNFGIIEEVSLYYTYGAGKISNELDSEAINPSKISPAMSKKWCVDEDGDYYGSDECKNSESECESGGDVCVPIGGDCDDDPIVGTCPDYDNIKKCSIDDPGYELDYSKCAICRNPRAVEVCDGIDNDCDNIPDDGADASCPELTPYCDDGACNDIKDYVFVDNGATGTLKNCDGSWSSEFTGDSETISVDWPSIKFYKDTLDPMESIIICKQGHIVFAGSSCYTGISPNTADLASRKTIAPYMISSVDIDSGSYRYCKNSGNIIISWTDNGGKESQAVLYSDGKIEYYYVNSPSFAEVGISYGSGGYATEKVSYGGSIENNYKLLF